MEKLAYKARRQTEARAYFREMEERVSAVIRKYGVAFPQLRKLTSVRIEP